MRPPSAILFDWDNTLVDSWGCLHQAMNATLTAMGRDPWDMAEIKQRVALSLRDSFPALFGNRWEEARDVFYSSFASIHLQLLQPLPGAGNILLRLQDAGIPMGVVSNKRGWFIRQEAESLGWAPYFKGLVGAGDAAADKPSDMPVRLALEIIGVTADHNVWFVGDAPVDMECAANAGVRALLVKHDEWQESAFALHPPVRQFRSWEEFDLMLDEILVP